MAEGLGGRGAGGGGLQEVSFLTLDRLSGGGEA